MEKKPETPVAENSHIDIDDLDIVRLDHHSFNEAKSILYQAYLGEPAFKYIFGGGRPGYEQRVRATMQALMQLHVSKGQDVIGIAVDKVLIGVAYISDPNVRLKLAEQINWRLRMILTAGLAATHRYIDLHEQISELQPTDQHHELPLIAVHPNYQGQRIGTTLLEAVEQICAEHHKSTGIGLDTGNLRYVDFFRSLGYEKVGEAQIGPIKETVLFKPTRKLVRR
ncbi:MAG: GNAT family N-acetyltransferase [Gammaproteobacteria bacterium]|nr:MAG: GNAT family N-acetyltransferase [Gammaproteobacteria bacterium]